MNELKLIKLMKKRKQLLSEYNGKNNTLVIHTPDDMSWYGKNIAPLDNLIVLMAQTIVNGIENIYDVYQNKQLKNILKNYKRNNHKENNK